MSLRHLWMGLGAIVVVGAAVAAYVTYAGSATDEPGAATASRSGDATASAGATQTAQAGGPLAVGPDDQVLGAADAPVVIVEYASYTCPHCAAFHEETLPRIESEFIEQGQVQLVFREFLRNQVDLTAALLARCAPEGSFFNLVAVLFRSQDNWAFGDQPVDALKQIGRTAGLDPAKMDQCLADEALKQRLIEQTRQAYETLKVEGTPTFFVNGTMYPNLPFDDYEDGSEKKAGFGKIIRELLPKT